MPGGQESELLGATWGRAKTHGAIEIGVSG